MTIDRRQFGRLQLSEAALAVDEDGRELGKVSQASGGGILIHASSSAVAESLSMGKRLQVTVLEPGTQTSNTIDMVVRYKEGEKVGMEFVTGTPEAQAGSDRSR